MKIKIKWDDAAIGWIVVSAMSILAGCGGSVDSSSAQSPKPVVTISVEPNDVVRGDTVTIRWSTTDTTSCMASGDWRGAKPTSGSEQLATRDSGKVPFTLTCTGPGGSAKNTAIAIAHRGVSS